jgi:hypothetical protein
MNVNGFSVEAPDTVSFKVAPGDDVTGCPGKLFFFANIHNPNDNGSVREEWTSEELTQGVTFPFDATGKQQYEISLDVTANADTTLTADTTFENGSSAPGHDVVPIEPATLNELTWEFVPRKEQ